MSAIVMVYQVTELAPIRRCLSSHEVQSRVIRTPEWVKEKDAMCCNSALEVQSSADVVKSIFSNEPVPLRGVFEAERQTA